MAEKMELPQIPRFNGGNYNMWKFQMTVILRTHGLLGIVEGSDIKPSAGAETGTIADWNTRNARAMMLLSTAMDYSQLECLITCETAEEMWTRLKSIHEQKSESSKLLLQQRFFDYRMSETDSMAQHIAKVESLAQQLKDVGEKVSEVGVMAKLLGSLPNKFANLITAWDSVEPSKQTKENLIARLLKEESRLTASEELNNALVTTMRGKLHASNRQAASRNSRKPEDSSKNFRCFYCKKEGHFKRNCRLFKSKMKSQFHSTRSDNSDTVFSAECSYIFSAADDDVWLADSGASRHMTNHREWLESFEDSSCEPHVRLGDNKQLKVAGKGNVRCQAYANGKWINTLIKDVLYVPELKKSLFSVGAVTAKGIKVIAQGNACHFYNQGRLVATGVKEANHLYRMLFKITGPLESNVAMTSNLKLWHERLGHINIKAIKEMANRHLVEGLVIDEHITDLFCESCQYGKQHRRSFASTSPSSEKRSNKPGEFLHIDLAGPFSTPSVGGANYYMCIKDDYSGYRFVYFLRHKADAISKMKECITHIKNMTGNKVKTVRSDNGTEFCNAEFTKMFCSLGIKHERTAPYTPEQNGLIERDNRTIVESARSMLYAKDVQKSLWAEAVNTAVYILNRTLCKRSNGITPYEIWTGRRPKLAHVRVFGSEAFVHVPKEQRRKLDTKSKKVILVGYQNESSNYRLYEPGTRKIIISRDVTFNENSSTHLSPTTFRVQFSEGTESSEGQNSSEGIAQDDQPQMSEMPYTLRERVSLRPPERYQANLVAYSEPESYADARQRPDAEKWMQAMQEEMAAHDINNTWSLTIPPADSQIIGSKWVFRVKKGQDGKINYKARLCAKGFSQRPGIDYFETFSPVVRYDSIRTLLALATIKNMSIGQFDVRTAFLNGDLKEDVYMSQPEGFEDKDTTLVCKLNKSLYGLKQSPRAWNQKFSEYLNSLSFKQNEADRCVYFGKFDGHDIYLALYVDDGLILSESDVAVETLLDHLSKRFQLTVCEPNSFIGLEIKRDKDRQWLFIGQQAYVRDILHHFNMDQCKPVSVPADPNVVLSKEMCPTDDTSKTEMSKIPYREAVGKLLFAATVSRPDIMYAVSQVSRFLETPGYAHWRAVKRIIRYLQETKEHGILYQKDGNIQVQAFSDADFARDIDGRRSTSGSLLMMANGPVMWLSQLQRTVALSTTESEYIAASDTSREILWLKCLLRGIDSDTDCDAVLRVDNQSAIKLTKNPEFHKRTKHISVRYHFIRQLVESKEFAMEYISSDSQLADILTKPLARAKFRQIRDSLGVIECPLSHARMSGSVGNM